MMAGMAMTPPSLGARIRRARERAQLSQEDLAKAVGASVRALSDWERNEHKPRNRLGALEDVLGVRLDSGPEEARPAIPEDLRRDIMNRDDLTLRERQAAIEAIEEALSRERGEGAVSAPASADPGQSRQASLSACPFAGSAVPCPDPAQPARGAPGAVSTSRPPL